MSISTEIQRHIERFPWEKPFLSSKLFKYGSRTAVDKILSRLASTGKIVRIARGIYARPKENRYVGQVLPGIFEIAKAIAAKTNSIIQVHGAEAARQFGFMTQVPAQPIFYTTGQSREFKLGNLAITFKHISPRKLALAESRVGIAILALWYLGKKQITPQSIEMIEKKLSVEEFEKFKSSAEYMPYWMVEIISQYEKAKLRD